MASQSVVYALRVSQCIKDQLPVVAAQYNFLNSQELVRAILGMIVSGQVKLTLLQEEGVKDESQATDS